MNDRTQHKFPLTLARLMSLKKGERIVFYKGDLTLDINRSPDQGRHLLEDVKATAERLQNEGKIAVGRHCVERHMPDATSRYPKTWKETVYTAEGLA